MMKNYIAYLSHNITLFVPKNSVSHVSPSGLGAFSYFTFIDVHVIMYAHVNKKYHII